MEQQTVIRRHLNGETTEERVDLPPMPAHVNEGKTVAGWTLMWVTGLGAVLVALGFPLASTGLFIAGGAVIAVGLVASAVLRAMGLGQPLSRRQADED